MLALQDIKANQNNPRIISESKLKKLINSLLVFPKMMSLRPITLDENLFNLGGNMRQTALGRIAQMKYGELKDYIEQLPEFADLPDGGAEVLAYWKKFLRKPMAYVQIAYDLTEDEKQAFIIKDNVSFGDWDYDELETWNKDRLEAWGVETSMPDFGQEGGNTWGGQEDGHTPADTETSRLSELKFVDCYYTPEEQPEINLSDCVDMSLFDKKLKVIDDSSLPQAKKDMLRLFAYRFIRIDFESVANYYAFNATDEEKRVIERLRMVLVDGSLDGFFEDGMIRVNEHFNN